MVRNKCCSWSTMLASSFCQKTPNFPWKYQTSPIPNIIDQLVFINANTCCSWSLMNYIFITMDRKYHKNLFCGIFRRFIFWWPLTCYKPTDKLFSFFSYDPPYSRGNNHSMCSLTLVLRTLKKQLICLCCLEMIEKWIWNREDLLLIWWEWKIDCSINMVIVRKKSFLFDIHTFISWINIHKRIFSTISLIW